MIRPRSVNSAVGILAVALLAAAAPAGWSATIGPGDVDATDNDGSGKLIVLSDKSPVTLAAGTWRADQFSYQFSRGSNTNQSTTLAGSAQPLLAKSAGDNEVLALGDAVSFNSTTAFTSTPFGGTDTFTLSSSTDVLAGVFLERSTGQAMALGYKDQQSSSHLHAGSGANDPVVGAPVTGGNELDAGRKYDFSVSASIIPEPASLALLAPAGLLALRRRH